MHVDMNGDSEGNFSVLALQRKEFRTKNFSCTHQMVPVGYFLQGENLVNTSIYINGIIIIIINCWIITIITGI